MPGTWPRRHAALLLATALALPAQGGDAARGRRLYESRCAGCHDLDAHRVGPAHRNVFGRRAGSQPDFEYSVALRDSNLVWNAPTLDAWLADPQATIPGQRMGYSVADPTDRADLIEYLKDLRIAR